MRMRLPIMALAVAALLLVSACGGGDGTATVSPRPVPDRAVEQTPASTAPTVTPPTPEATAADGLGDVATVRVIGRRDHDATAFTQGLEFHDGRLYESRGLYAGQEQVILTEIDPADGSTIRQVQRPADPDVFAEGLTVVGDRIIQITWREQLAFVYDRVSLEPTGTFSYQGEGWGICDLPDRLIMSDGTATLTHRDPDTFEVLRQVQVDLTGFGTDDINELECVDGMVWANLWNTDRILVIDPDSGAVVTEVDAAAIAFPDGRNREDPGGGGAVLNGIAFDSTSGTWLLTGKRWPYMYEVEFDCVVGCEVAQAPLNHYVRPRPRPLPT